MAQEALTKRSASDTLIAVLEDYGQDEPLECMVITKHTSGDVSWSSTTDELSTKLGLIEFVGECVRAQIRKGLK